MKDGRRLSTNSQDYFSDSVFTVKICLFVFYWEKKTKLYNKIKHLCSKDETEDIILVFGYVLDSFFT